MKEWMRLIQAPSGHVQIIIKIYVYVINTHPCTYVNISVCVCAHPYVRIINAYCIHVFLESICVSILYVHITYASSPPRSHLLGFPPSLSTRVLVPMVMSKNFASPIGRFFLDMFHAKYPKFPDCTLSIYLK